MPQAPEPSSHFVEHAHSIFEQPWWLDAVAPGEWSAVEIRSGGRIEARMPFVSDQRLGLRLLRMPKLTQNLGPWIRHPESSQHQRLAREKDLMEQLIEGLPPFDRLQQHWHHSMTNWLPFYWKGFEQTTRYTYLLDDLSSLDRIWAGFRGNIRREIKKAEQRVEVSVTDDPSTLLSMVTRTYARQEKRVPFPVDLLLRIDQACRARDVRRILVARGDDGRAHAAMLLVWDPRAAYYLIGGADEALRNSGAQSLLMWHAIRTAATVTRTFNFEGSMIEPIERFFRAFGARQAGYFAISKTSRRMDALLSARRLLRDVRGS